MPRQGRDPRRSEPTAAGRLYGLAGYFLVSSGRDALRQQPGGTPDDWWSGYDTTSAAPSTTAIELERRLAARLRGGVALLNEPGAPTRTVSLPSGLHDLSGNPRSSVTLGPGSGAVLLR